MDTDKIKKELAYIVNDMDTMNQLTLNELRDMATDVRNSVFRIYDIMDADDEYDPSLDPEFNFDVGMSQDR